MFSVKIEIGDDLYILNLDLVATIQTANVSKREDDYPYKLKLFSETGTCLHNIGWKEKAGRDDCFDKLTKLLKAIDLDDLKDIEPESTTALDNSLEQKEVADYLEQKEDILGSKYDPMEAIKPWKE